MTAADLDAARERLRPYVERARTFSGWTEMPAARLAEPLPWDYGARARTLVASASSLLDIGTGGGERLALALAGYRGRAAATEEWAVNAPVASARLRPTGVHVVHAADEQLPFADASFDLVLDRHSSLRPADVARVLRPGGRVLTQQVGTANWRELRDFIARAQDQADLWGDHWRLYREGFVASGLTLVDARFHHSREAYASLGDFVFMLCITPWTVPDFDPLGGDLEALLRLESALTTPAGLAVTSERYVIEALKPA